MNRDDSHFDLFDLDSRLRLAVKSYWQVRETQGRRQGQATGTRDAGNRVNVTGGKHLDSLVSLIVELVQANCPSIDCYTQAYVRDPATVLPGYFRATKLWDIVFMRGKTLVGCVELKSQVGPSFGNNYNNRSEEAVGSACDLSIAFREGAFAPSPRPWSGYLLLLEDCPKSTRPVGVEEKHFPVFEEFREASYAKRYEVGLLRLVREGFFSATSFLLSQRDAQGGEIREPSTELSFRRFCLSLLGHAASVEDG